MPLVGDDSAVASLTKSKEFDELLHWHSGKPLSDNYDRCKHDPIVFTDPKERKWKLKQKQQLAAFYKFYGRSLEGSISKHIVLSKKENLPTTNNESAQTKRLKKSSLKSKAELIVEENMKKKKEKMEQKEMEQWNILSAAFEKEINANFTEGVQRLEVFLKTCHSQSVKFVAEMAGLDSCFKVWGRHYRDTALQEHQCDDDSVTVTQWHRKLASDIKLDKKPRFALQTGSARFQLQFMGHYLQRDERKDPDPRVQHFIPDTWQRELLDAVDNNESAVIVAPTSSGKTYASYYCMEKVLRESNDGVVVYVAPTKALVNQVMATVCNRFDKTLPDGMTVCGVFTRDYRHDALNCQVLVTVPQCLEILMLSPHRQNWVQKIKYVIFDEVHCLGGEIGADVWEHLLVMIRCPFLALSATIRNPKDLAEWLQSVKRYWQKADIAIESSVSSNGTTAGTKKSKLKMKGEKKSYKVRLVTYGERYNDLEKYLCIPKKDGFEFPHYHPCAALTVNHIQKYGIPSDLLLSPQECIKLYDTMASVWQKWPKAQELDPEVFASFKDKVVIKKTDVRIYEEQLKNELTSWIKLGHIKEAGKVLHNLQPNVKDVDSKNCIKSFPLLVEELKKMDKLPALFFSFNILLVERLAEATECYLKEKEKSRRKPDTEKKIEHLENKLLKLAKYTKKVQSVDTLKPSSKTDREILKESELQALQRRYHEVSKISPDYTYANEKAEDKEILDKIFYRMRSQRSSSSLKSLLKRGIGFHHGSLNLKGRQAVEMLFRLGFVRVVTATGSLALGINMPCRTVVFVGDSVFLNALQVRQMSGRAGRRGFDMLGNVVFYDVPLPKVQRLMKADIPELKGQFPLSISLLLRLMLLEAKADDKADARAKVLSVLQHSMLSFNQPKKQQLLRLYFLFSQQFLLKEGYIDQEGIPQGFAGLVSHLHYHEPANFVFISFLEKGLFHKLCQPTQIKGSESKHFSEDVMETLVLVLASLFGRIYFPACSVKLKGTFEQSKVFLEDLPEDFAAAVNEYNTTIQEIFGSFLVTVSRLADKEQENQLPLSRISFAGGESFEDSKYVSQVIECSQRTAVSPFVCLSGRTNQDLFDARLVDNVTLQSIGIHSGNIPVLYLEKYDHQGRKLQLNAYAHDFYKHGCLLAIHSDNMIHKGDAFNLLYDFSLVISAISTSLDELCEDEEDNVVLAFRQLKESYAEKIEIIKS
nr:PREDICTED: probable ATP-dependent RNA helicase DDX60 [Latimeria chalumnae]|eukprot:XP_014342204.1 PREDICTED: probable ATP-dependent RNA helicase DDX60 [Latimeria chalumnae]